MAEVGAEMQGGLAADRDDLVMAFAEIRAEIASHRAHLIKWMFIFWVATVIPLAGLMIALL